MNEDRLLPLFEWFEATALGTVVRNSLWAFPIIEALHLVALCLLGGALLTVDLRLLGLGLKNQPIDGLAAAVRPWLKLALAAILLTGVLLFFSEAIKLYFNRSFWVKISVLPVAILFTFGVRDRIIRKGALETSAKSRLLGLTSMALWFTVAAAGRWIGFS